VINFRGHDFEPAKAELVVLDRNHHQPWSGHYGGNVVRKL
jgi:hypothetical protein